MKIGICLIIKDENEYLDEWLTHYRNLGVDRFFIYDNNSSTPIKVDSDDVDVILWNNEEFGSQNNSYLDCCQKYKNFDYIGFFDTDEFYISNTMNIKEDLINLTNKFGKFDGLGIYWRMYGNPKPYFTERKPINEYIYYYNNNHIKSFINPKTIRNFPDPHYPSISGRYIDELGRNVNSPIGNHTSKTIWLKHIWTRSISEFENKLKRGDANKVLRNRTMQDFIKHNDDCVISDIND
jgi:hypothetical protein